MENTSAALIGIAIVLMHYKVVTFRTASDKSCAEAWERGYIEYFTPPGIVTTILHGHRRRILDYSPPNLQLCYAKVHACDVITVTYM